MQKIINKYVCLELLVKILLMKNSYDIILKKYEREVKSLKNNQHIAVLF